MAHGYPDWGGAEPVPTIYRVPDVGELAARLGSPNYFDRRGNVLFVDNFANGIEEFYPTGDPVGWKAEWSALYSLTSGFSMRLQTNNSVDAYIDVEHYFPYPVISKMAVEVAFSSLSIDEDFTIHLWINTADDFYGAGVKWVGSEKIWKYRRSDDIYYPFGDTFKSWESGHLFYIAKLIVDFPNLKYDKFIFNDVVNDLSGKAIRARHLANAFNPSGEVMLDLANRNFYALLYIGHIIITQNEP